MDLKKLTGKLTTIVAAGAMVMSIGGVVWANNCKDEYAHMSFDESAGEYLDYTRGRDKQDTSCGYIKGVIHRMIIHLMQRLWVQMVMILIITMKILI